MAAPLTSKLLPPPRPPLLLLLLISVPFSAESFQLGQRAAGSAAKSYEPLEEVANFNHLFDQQQQQLGPGAFESVPEQLVQPQLDWAQRLSGGPSLGLGQSPVLQQQHPLAGHLLDQPARQGELFGGRQQPPTAPKILKSLINSTLESLAAQQRLTVPAGPRPQQQVPQAGRALAAARDFLRQQASQPVATFQQVAGSRPGSSVGNRLYNFLFPSQQQQQMASGWNQTQTSELVASSPFRDDERVARQQPRGRKSGGSALINLSAPYEQSAQSNGLEQISLVTAASQPEAISGDKWRRDVVPEPAPEVSQADEAEQGAEQLEGGSANPSSSSEQQWSVSGQLGQEEEEGAELEQPNEQQQQQVLADSMGPDDPGGEHLVETFGVEQQPPVGGQLPVNESAPDTLLAAVQLPSQYESAIGLPPEGHYDDYFKPASSFQEPQLHQGSAELAPASHNYQEAQPSPADEPPRPADYTMQYYLNQQPLRQSEAAEDQSVEFVTANRSLEDSTGSGHFLNHHQYSHQQLSLNSSAPEMNSTSRNQTTTSGEENIQLIVANSNLARDPTSNERLITYTSEGHNQSLASGKPARQTFVNKDLNELPPGEGGPASAALRGNETGGAKSGAEEDEGGRAPAIELRRPDHLLQQAGGPPPPPPPPPSATDESEALLGGQLGQFEAARRQPANRKRDHLDRAVPGGGRQRRRERTHRHHQEQPAAGGRGRHQASLRRPQVTEAKLQLRDLALAAPTPAPSLTESALSSAVELPAKVEKFRKNRPDKDELMNELLTALDRVKVAIYKLQPLTARMNAMYRKSVTGNTRDFVLDHHKGTYTKRYPPGDYDDSYDRLQPVELLERQRSASARRARQTAGAGERREEPLEASGSTGSGVYLPAPSELIEQHRCNRSLAANLTQSPVGAGELELVAAGVGQKLAEGKFRGQLSLSTPTGGQIVFDDDDEGGAPSGFSRRLGELVNETGAGERPLDDEDVQSPLFGYRITIYQSPVDGGADDEDDQVVVADTLARKPSDRNLAYSLLGQSERSAGDEEEEEALATSESSLVVASSSSSLPLANSTEPETLEAGESEEKKKLMKERRRKMEKKMAAAEEEAAKRAKKGKGGKGAEKWAKAESKGKRGEATEKKRKEFKKIKHNKGLTSKESHKLHRDKQIKAHDRGAAKEKALKERTQIEFFEREQIVDDEFEKAKKATTKAGWASGHDSKRTLAANGGLVDSMAAGASQPVGQQQRRQQGAAPTLGDQMPSESVHHSDKVQGHSVESSSGRQENKFQKKQMEAKGKKFKGWREKGYKIITETEFIDRGRWRPRAGLAGGRPRADQSF